MADLTLTTSSPAGLKVDAVVVGLHESPRGPVLAAGAEQLDTAFGGRLARTLAALGATGAAEQVVKVPGVPGVSAPVVVGVGLGAAPARRSRDGVPAETLRRAAGAAVRALAGSPRVALALPAAGVDAVRALAEGALLGAYAFTQFRSAHAPAQPAPPTAVTLVSPVAREGAARAAAERARTVAAAVALTRDLVNTPPSHLPPRVLAERAQQALAELPVEVEVLDERVLKRRGFGGIMGVGQGSANPPRLVKLSYRGGGEDAPHVALVGKGITFDSGGLSLKPPASMVTMKCDMGGAAAVLGAVQAAAALGVPVRVTGWMPLAENMPSGTATRPSDVLTIYGGRTVEVLNTDAEGRLVLADAIVAACEEHPDVLVDAATLTGAQMVALGSRTSAVMGNSDALREAVARLAGEAGEAVWPMPLPEELRKSMDSPVADIANMGDRYGGMLVAGLFLKEFVAEGVPWAHLDIAGPAFNEGEAYGYTPKGGTGAAVRTLLAVVEQAAARALPL
ncbi:leucyl aminopeptidase [Motilibacter rhizosphaerae]|uniref:Probable cytosol aminopeptidase n=1 Tax=Motilibacter rhizosphaerae TaxID=598652 RepID=A0A4Q7NR88_9ACTN|nr:leucyl aminopeptidase [Motilibacter rhizosphaerae]RZS89583.1 leucyl aminopeptidase [Motilibacter rhizosphaerae]